MKIVGPTRFVYTGLDTPNFEHVSAPML